MKPWHAALIATRCRRRFLRLKRLERVERGPLSMVRAKHCDVDIFREPGDHTEGFRP